MTSHKVWVVVEATTAAVNGILAGEALRREAALLGMTVDVEIRAADGVQNAFSGVPARNDVLLLVGKVEADDRFAGISVLRAEIKDVFADVAGILRRCGSTHVSGHDGGGVKRIVAVTSCPTGIAHTFMAAEGLQQAAGILGYEMRVETQGSVGVGTPLTLEEIAAADLVVIAADRDVECGRFVGKPIFFSGAKKAITDGQGLIKTAFSEALIWTSVAAEAGAAAPTDRRPGPYKHLMTGVSFMLPFVVAGGLLIALAFALGGIDVGEKTGTLGHALMLIGSQGGFSLVIPVLAGYIAYSVADRPGIAPGMIGGILCNILGAGFLGGIAAGFIAGYGTHHINRAIPLPKTLTGLKPVLILPLLGTLFTGLIMYYVVGTPAAALNVFLKEWLNGLQGAGSIAFGLLLGGMMALDMGGPVNKAAYAFSTGMLESQIYTPMAAAMAAGMVPPLAAALSTRLFKNRYTEEEREAGGAAFILGLAFISEGAIPFAARDPLRVIPAFVVGSAVSAAVSMSLGVKLMVPHGGVFVLPIPNAVSDVFGFAVTLIVGTLISALIMGLLKKPALSHGAKG